MLYRSETGNWTYDALILQARAERARVTLDLLVGAARGIRASARMAARGGRSLISRWAEARKRSAAILELQSFDDRMLRDIGVTRSEIRAFVDGILPADRARQPRRTFTLVANTGAELQIPADSPRKAA